MKIVIIIAAFLTAFSATAQNRDLKQAQRHATATEWDHALAAVNRALVAEPRNNSAMSLKVTCL